MTRAPPRYTRTDTLFPYTTLFRSGQLAVHVTAGVQDFAQLGMVEVTADVKPGVDADMVAKRLDAIIADYIAKGPTADEMQRVATQTVSGRIAGLEQVGGRSEEHTPDLQQLMRNPSAVLRVNRK